MTSPIRMAGFAALMLASGCSSDGSNERAIQALSEFTSSRFRAAPEITIPAGATYVVATYAGGRTPMIVQHENKNGITQYKSSDGVQMTLNNGFLSRLRGLGQEYEAFYVDEASPYREGLIKAAREKRLVTRTIEYWIDQRPKRDRLRCTLAFARIEKGFRRLSETCNSIYGPLNFTNHYWTDRNAILAFSQQWFHPKASPLEIDHIRQTSSISEN